MEKIKSAAIRSKGKIYEGYSHADIYANNDFLEHDEEGFITQSGKFIDRVEAMKVAKEAGQIRFCGPIDEVALHSCDLI